MKRACYGVSQDVPLSNWLCTRCEQNAINAVSSAVMLSVLWFSRQKISFTIEPFLAVSELTSPTCRSAACACWEVAHWNLRTRLDGLTWYVLWAFPRWLLETHAERSQLRWRLSLEAGESWWGVRRSLAYM